MAAPRSSTRRKRTKSLPDDDKPVLFMLRPEMTDDELQAICDAINEGQREYDRRHRIKRPPER